MKRERTSYAFLMEMIWVCAFFLICASIFVMAFAKAETISRQADVLNQAVQAVSNALEDGLADAGDGTLDDASVIISDYETEHFSISLDSEFHDGLFTLTVNAINPEDHTILYSLTGSRAVMEGGTL